MLFLLHKYKLMALWLNLNFENQLVCFFLFVVLYKLWSLCSYLYLPSQSSMSWQPASSLFHSPPPSQGSSLHGHRENLQSHVCKHLFTLIKHSLFIREENGHYFQVVSRLWGLNKDKLTRVGLEPTTSN